MSSAPEANELANRLDRVLPPHSRAVQDYTAGQNPAVDAAVRLARGPHPVLADDLVTQIETEVLARAALVPGPRYARRRRVTFLARWAAAACLALVIAVVGTASASASSLPGERLYPVKRLVEQGRLALSGDAGDVDLWLAFADRRLDEFETLLDQGTVDLNPLEDAIDDMHSTLRLVEAGAGSAEDAQRLVELSERHVRLAETARQKVQADPATSSQLLTTVADATEVHEKARQLAAPRRESPTTLTTPVPDVIQSYSQRRSLVKDAAGRGAPEARHTLTSPDPGGTTVLIPTPASAAIPLWRDPAPEPRLLVEASPPPGGTNSRPAPGAVSPDGDDGAGDDPTPGPGDDPAPDQPPADDPTPEPTPGDEAGRRIPVDDALPPGSGPAHPPGGNRPGE